MPMTHAERQRRYERQRRAKRDPKFFLLEANELFDRVSKGADAQVAEEIFHLIVLEATKRKRRLARLERVGTQAAGRVK